MARGTGVGRGRAWSGGVGVTGSAGANYELTPLNCELNWNI